MLFTFLFLDTLIYFADLQFFAVQVSPRLWIDAPARGSCK